MSVTDNVKEFLVSSEQETKNIAAELAERLKTGDCVLLEGELGAGKTFFAKAIIQALSGENVNVTSPTFNIVQSYPVTTKCGNEKTTLYHYDLYRINHPSELYEIGLEESLLEGISLIEWSAIAVDFLPPTTLKVTIKNVEKSGDKTNDESRRITINDKK